MFRTQAILNSHLNNLYYGILFCDEKELSEYASRFLSIFSKIPDDWNSHTKKLFSSNHHPTREEILHALTKDILDPSKSEDQQKDFLTIKKIAYLLEEKARDLIFPNNARLNLL